MLCCVDDCFPLGSMFLSPPLQYHFLRDLSSQTISRRKNDLYVLFFMILFFCYIQASCFWDLGLDLRYSSSRSLLSFLLLSEFSSSCRDFTFFPISWMILGLAILLPKFDTL